MFRLALIDLRLPGQDGAALAARLQALAPGLAVVLMTADGIAPLRGQRGCFAGYLRKPFRADDLLGEVRRALCRAA
jgi:FixJ family two-component response regulator